MRNEILHASGVLRDVYDPSIRTALTERKSYLKGIE